MNLRAAGVRRRTRQVSRGAAGATGAGRRVAGAPPGCTGGLPGQAGRQPEHTGGPPEHAGGLPELPRSPQERAVPSPRSELKLGGMGQRESGTRDKDMRKKGLPYSRLLPFAL